jgi:hypothetical protein
MPIPEPAPDTIATFAIAIPLSKDEMIRRRKYRPSEESAHGVLRDAARIQIPRSRRL